MHDHLGNVLTCASLDALQAYEAAVDCHLHAWPDPLVELQSEAEIGLRFAGSTTEERRATVARYLDLVGLTKVEALWPKQLSGGMRKRAELARAYATNSDCLLMDEPFGALDVLTRRNMQSALLTLWTQSPRPILFITHDIEEAIFLSDRVIVMTRRPAKIQREVKISFPRPRSEELRRDKAFVALVGVFLRQSFG